MNRALRCVVYSLLLMVVGMGSLALISGCSSGTTSTSSGGAGGTGGTGSTWTGGGDGIWRRNAVYAEASGFDPCNAHPQQQGQYHYHDNPVCLRYQEGDNITGANVGTLTATYTETTGTPVHSPLLGFAYDGNPVYGPYGYGTATNSGSAVRRMVSSYALRTDNTTTRTSLPGWAAVAQGFSTTMATYALTSTQYGPPVSTTYPQGRYIEDYQYTAGSGDLDQYNGRYCVTPEFPSGTYAYFITIDSTGKPAFPYYIGLQYYGTVGGSSVTSISESTTSYFANHAMVGSSSSVPEVNKWYTANSAVYAQYQNSAGTKSTTWTGQTSAVYADIQAIAYSASYVYVTMSGLASHIMGPFSGNPNLPLNQNLIVKLPLTESSTAATTHSQTTGGANGVWVNGVAMFNMEDFFSWSYASQADVGN